jgi:hypothetical protein
VYDVNLYPDFIFFSDQRARLFTLPGVEDGAVVEYRYRLTVRNRTFWHSWQFQEEVPVLLSRFTLMKPSEWDMRYKTYGSKIEPAVTRTPAGFRSRYVWEAKDVPPLLVEPGMPPAQEVVQRLSIGPRGFNSWSDVSTWYLDLVKSRLTKSSSLRELAARLTDSLSSNDRKLESIFTWVRDRIRYIAVAIGIGGYQPNPAPDVMTKRYGDCKDMVTLLCALAEEAGIIVHPVLISTHQNGFGDAGFPSPLQFNHLIAYAPEIGTGVWMDPTEKACPFGELPWYDQGVPVLIVRNPPDTTMVITPAVPFRQNFSASSWEVAVRDSGDAVVQGITTMGGAPGLESRAMLMHLSPKDRRTWLESQLAERWPSVRLDSMALEGLAPPDDTLRILYRFNAALVHQPGSSLLTLLPAEGAFPPLAAIFRQSGRTHTVRVHYGTTTTVRISLEPPPHYRVEPCFRDSLISPFGTGFRAVTSHDTGVSVVLTQNLLGGDIPASEYPAFSSFLDSLRIQEGLVLHLAPRR